MGRHLTKMLLDIVTVNIIHTERLCRECCSKVYITIKAQMFTLYIQYNIK